MGPRSDMLTFSLSPSLTHTHNKSPGMSARELCMLFSVVLLPEISSTGQATSETPSVSPQAGELNL